MSTFPPPIGYVREYARVIEVLYPGEEAIVISVDDHGQITAWRVEPMRGLRGWFLRTRYRVSRWCGVQR